MANFGYIQVTRECNQHCRFCSNPPTGMELTLEAAKEMIAGFAANPEYSGVLLSGGEPTVSEMLPALIEHCAAAGLHCTVITNGQKLANMSYLKSLRDAGLKQIVLSLYSVNPEVQNFLTSNPDSHANIMNALSNLGELGDIRVDTGSVICKQNANHLSQNVAFIVSRFQFINHFIWNGLDPVMNRAAENPDTIPRLNDFQLQLALAVEKLTGLRKTFRISRVPLCYLAGFEYASTETRKIVKGEERTIYFLDSKGETRQRDFRYGKSEKCAVCALDDICAGLYSMDENYFSEELYPVFLSEAEKQTIIQTIRNG
ncbi:MAG: radical SAM protein [bacterium]